MQPEVNYKTKNIINILMASMTLLLIAIFIFNLEIPCLFKSILKINCPACGLSRSFKAIMNLDLIGAFKYNIIGVPLFLSIIIIYLIYLFDLFFKKNILVNLYNKFSKNYVFLIIVLFILGVLNNII